MENLRTFIISVVCLLLNAICILPMFYIMQNGSVLIGLIGGTLNSISFVLHSKIVLKILNNPN